MQDIENEKTEQESEEGKTGPSGIKKRLKRVSKGSLFTPAGIILIFFAVFIEVLDWIVVGAGIDAFTYELILEIIFALAAVALVGASFRDMIVPFLIERILVVSDAIPSFLIWIIRFLS